MADLERLRTELAHDRAARRAEAGSLLERLAKEHARERQEWRDEAEALVTAVLRRESRVLAELRTEVASGLADVRREQAEARRAYTAEIAATLAALLGPAPEAHDDRIDHVRRELGRWLDRPIRAGDAVGQPEDAFHAQLDAIRYELVPRSAEDGGEAPPRSRN